VPGPDGLCFGTDGLDDDGGSSEFCIIADELAVWVGRRDRTTDLITFVWGGLFFVWLKSRIERSRSILCLVGEPRV
jgi:hypothetical protein